jgi:hypothetical protein
MREYDSNGVAMTLKEFKALKRLENRRVYMIFSDGQEVIATLFSITTDLDESRHLIYDQVEWSALPHADAGAGAFRGKRSGELPRITKKLTTNLPSEKPVALFALNL